MKRHRFLLILVAFFVSSANAQTADPWRFAVSFDHGMVITAVLTEFPANFSRSTYPTCILITWNSPSEDGTPLPKQPKELRQFADTVERIASPDSGSIFVINSIGLMRRILAVYASEDSTVPRQIEEAARTETHLALSVKVVSDPDWKEYDQLRYPKRPAQ